MIREGASGGVWIVGGSTSPGVGSQREPATVLRGADVLTACVAAATVAVAAGSANLVAVAFFTCASRCTPVTELTPARWPHAVRPSAIRRSAPTLAPILLCTGSRPALLGSA